eukprot:363864-Chlamydomonas_euryale.AAC.28
MAHAKDPIPTAGKGWIAVTGCSPAPTRGRLCTYHAPMWCAFAIPVQTFVGVFKGILLCVYEVVRRRGGGVSWCECNLRHLSRRPCSVHGIAPMPPACTLWNLHLCTSSGKAPPLLPPAGPLDYPP